MLGGKAGGYSHSNRVAKVCNSGNKIMYEEWGHLGARSEDKGTSADSKH